jgi:hypothetical protein
LNIAEATINIEPRDKYLFDPDPTPKNRGSQNMIVQLSKHDRRFNSWEWNSHDGLIVTLSHPMK